MDEWEQQAFDARVKEGAKLRGDVPTAGSAREDVQQIRLELAALTALVASLNGQLRTVTRLFLTAIALLVVTLFWIAVS